MKGNQNGALEPRLEPPRQPLYGGILALEATLEIPLEPVLAV